ncbi:ribulose-phosphate 3-epimerase [Neoehrlichia mikurensis]|uniref:Ribulose-phosphate 3-epimerase n=1 Tax=Neoehrlichia mikurensis TaxID=89586 RepID=A0ABY5EZL6_9RICK|nr:ribulose-phosphate 3-epimerase [Neoehrlichia mikurensis]UTO56776.1 ribulose-phosphate 3-epimerase [Neoehrlichia mikurensis]
MGNLHSSSNAESHVKVAASILSADFANLGQSIKLVTEAGVDYIHIDVMDGNFVSNITIGPAVISSIRKYTNLLFDVHLMINSPSNYIEEFVNAGSDIITVHAESEIHLYNVIQKIKSYGKRVGISLVPTSHYSMLEYIIADIDLVLVMSVNPGFGGQKFLCSQLEKIEKIRNMIEKLSLNTKIAVDGGITVENYKSVVEAGANILIVGSTLFNAANMLNVVKTLKSI